jgi:hypothetical protein
VPESAFRLLLWQQSIIGGFDRLLKLPALIYVRNLI